MTLEPRYPWWVWPTLLSLEPPIVAVLWLQLLARVAGLHRTWPMATALALFVWLIYAGDRLLDAIQSPHARAPLRQFYRRHAIAIGCAMAAVAAVEIGLVREIVNPAIVPATIPVLGAVSVYLAIVHLPGIRRYRLWPRELAVGILFAAGIIVPVVARSGGGRSYLLEFGVLAMLLCLNVAGIKFWGVAGNHHPVTRWVGEKQTMLGVTLAIGCLGLVLLGHPPPFYLAIAGSALLLAVLPYARHWKNELWCMAADSALCTPLLVPTFWR